MLHFSRSGLALIFALIFAGLIYFSFNGGKDDTGLAEQDEVSEAAAISAQAGREPKSDRPAVQPAKEKEATAAASAVAAEKKHAAAQARTSKEAESQLLTNPKADPIFKQLARMENKMIPPTTFDFLKGSQKGDAVSFEIGELAFDGTISHARENHPQARNYGIQLDNNLGRVLVKTDAAGALAANIFFMDDSRVILANEARVEGQGSEGQVLVVEESTVATVICAPPDAIFTASGFRSLSATNADALSDAANASPASGTKPTIPALESLPGSKYVIYLDFDGEIVTGTGWNGPGLETIDADPLPRASEEEWVKLVWQRVAEDFAPFNINVTTDEAVFNAPDPEDPNDPPIQHLTKRLHVIITPTDDAAQGFGGVAFTHSFREDTPIVWVFNDTEYTCASTISHEAGHAFGLSHDGDAFQIYYPGHNGSYRPGWGAIMGAPFPTNPNNIFPPREVDQWSIGDYANASNQEDDLAILGDDEDPQIAVGGISNGFGFKADDHADAYNEGGVGGFEIAGENQIQASGLISTTNDVDVFAFSATEGLLRFVISPLDVNSIYSERGSDTSGANLAVNARLLDANGQVVAEGEPAGDNLLSSLVETSVAAGTHYIAVTGGGRGDNPDTGFSDYASLGQYAIAGELALPPLSVSGGAKQTVTIFNGATNVDFGTGTDFGFTTPGDTVENEFILKNSGGTLDITDLDIALAGGSASQFKISSEDSFDLIAPGTGQFFGITYDPATTGTHSDTVVITYQAGEPQVFEFTVRGSATNSSSADNYEPNNNANDAYSLNASEDTWLRNVKGLAFFISDQHDWYSFTADAADDLIRLDTALEPDTENVSFELVHHNGQRFEVLASTTGGQLQYLIPEHFTGSQLKFYIHVETLEDSTVRNAYDLRWSSVELLAGGDDLYEDNNSREEAYDLTEFGTQLSQILGLGVSNDEDWYKIEIERDPFIRMLYVAALFDHSQGNIDIEVYRETVLKDSSETDEDKELVTVHDTIDFNNYPDPFTFNPTNNFLVMGVEPGTYYVRVTGDFAGNKYDLIVDPMSDDRYETVNDTGTENDLRNNAFPLGEEIVGQWLSAIDGPGTTASYPDSATTTNFANTGDNDWYAFSIGGTDTIGQISLNFINLNGGGTVEFSLYDSAGELLTSTQDDLGNIGVLTVDRPVGRDFFVRVEGSNANDSALSGYDFRISFTNQPPLIQDPIEDNYEQNDRFDQLYNISSNEGRWLSSIAGYGTQLDQDWFQISIPGNAAKLETSLVFVKEDGDLNLNIFRGAQVLGLPADVVSSSGTTTATSSWEDPDPGQYALTVSGEDRGNF